MKTIGMIVPTTDNSFFSSLAHEVTRKMKELGYRVMIMDSGNDAETEKDYLTSEVSGFIDISGLKEVPELKVPTVFADRKPESLKPIYHIANDDEQAMKEAAEYLLEKGCRNIVLMPGYIAEQQDNPRIRGYRRALEEAGLEFDETNVITRQGTASSELETAELVLNRMREGKKIDGIITSSDRAAFGALRALGSVGLYVPEDVKLISFDNSPYSSMASPSITSIDRNPKFMAEKACETLIALMEGKPAETEQIIPVSLVKRDSTR